MPTSILQENPFMEIPATNPSRRAAGSKRARPASMEVVSQPLSQTVRTITRLPVAKYRKGNPYKAVHRFKRTFNLGIQASSALTNTLLALNFSMNDMPGYTELTTLFDSYKLTGIRFRMIPYYQTDSNSVGSTNNSRNVPVFYVIDRNDSTAPSTLDELLEYQDHKITNWYKGFDLYIKNPKFADATSALRGGWVATSNPSLNWYGLKIALPPTETAGACYFLVTYYVACKDPK